MGSKSPRNILYLMTDQQRVDSLGCYGNPIIKTPALDSLASQGTRFDQCYTPTAICTPARATLLTGLLPFRHALVANYERNVAYREELDPSYIPFSHYLLEAGYKVGLVGKWHVGKEKGPAEYGFEGLHYQGWGNPVKHPDYQAYLAERNLPPFKLHNEVRGTFPNGQPGNLLAGMLEQPLEATFEYYLADRTIERLKQYADNYKRTGQPFYLACHWFGPHLPYLIPEKYYKMYDPAQVKLPASVGETFAGKPAVQKNYSAHWTFDSFSLDDWRKIIALSWGYVTLIDEQVGRVLEAARELDLFDSTAIMFSVDHGAFVGAHRLEDKGPAMYDDIYHIPLLLRLPDSSEVRVDDNFVMLTDFMPTFLDLAGVKPPDDLDGESFLPLAQGETPDGWRQEVIAEFHGHHFPYPQRMIRTRRYKLVVNPGDLNELYDLETDPNELLNQYEHPELRSVRQELMTRLYNTLKARGDNFYHWMTTMYDIGTKTYDTSLSQFDSK
ncbi:MAG TPA: sulfatase-like hydrolase/transferase [Chloroflexia bacterium]|nr:sulfatase-like hydrolase/transferase [Chloroflexia bacterium]